MQGLNPGRNEGNKQGGLSWSTPAQQGNQKNSNQVSPLLSGSKLASTPPKSPNNSSSVQVSANDTSTRQILIFIAGVVVGIIIMWLWGVVTGPSVPGSQSTSTPTTTNNSNSTATTGSQITSTTLPSTTSTNDIVVLAQDAGNAVVVKDTTVSVPTWLVVYELFEGKPIRALGATMFFPEYNGKGGIISLLRNTQPNTTYFVGMSLDTGDHTFTPHVNKEVLDSNGSMVGTTFKTN